jgi:hypothetical protein
VRGVAAVCSRARVRQAILSLLAAARRVLPQKQRQQLTKLEKQAAVAASRAARKEAAGASHCHTVCGSERDLGCGCGRVSRGGGGWRCTAGACACLVVSSSSSNTHELCVLQSTQCTTVLVLSALGVQVARLQLLLRCVQPVTAAMTMKMLMLRWCSLMCPWRWCQSSCRAWTPSHSQQQHVCAGEARSETSTLACFGPTMISIGHQTTHSWQCNSISSTSAGPGAVSCQADSSS